MSKSKTSQNSINQQIRSSPKAHIVDRFTVSTDDRDLLLEKIKITHNVLRTFPGFSQNYVFEQNSDDKKYNVIAITEWDNQEFLDGAINAIMQFPEDKVFIKTSGHEFEIEKHEHNYSQIPFTPDEITKTTLVDQIESYYSEFMSIVGSYSEEILCKEIINDWSIKDYIMHLAMWQATVTNLLNKKPRYNAMNIPKGIWETQDNNKINAALKEKYGEMSASDVLELFKSNHKEFIQKVNTMSIDELLLPYNYYEKSSDNEVPVISLVSGIGIYHISSHINELSKAMSSE